LLHHETAVQQIQRLQRRGAPRALRRDLPAVGTIEHTEDTIGPLSYHRAINHTAKRLGSELMLRGINPHVVIVWLEETENRPAHRQIQRSADGENRVAERFGFEAAPRKALEQTRICVHGETFLARLAPLPVSRTGDDEALNVFDGPGTAGMTNDG